MKCTFTYKNGRVFNSELALDEFIVNSLKYDGTITDIVFDYSTKQKNANTIITKRDEVAKKKMQGYEQIRLESDIFEDYDTDMLPPGHIPVTRGLTEYVDEYGNILFPIFNEENYWQNKIRNDWNDLSYWNGTRGGSKIATQNEINAVFGEGIRPQDITNIPTPDQIEKGKKLISASWPMQGFMGTGIHRMFEAYWKAINNKIFDDNALKQTMKNSLTNFNLISDKTAQNPKYAKYKGIKFSEIIPDSVIDSTLEACKKLHKELNDRFGQDLLFMPEVSAITAINGFSGDKSITNLVGNFDLLVIDKNGAMQIIDYKTSPKNYIDYDTSKKLTFSYQLATYRRMLERMGFSLGGDSKVFVAPIKFNNFQLHNIDLEKGDIRTLLTFDSVTVEDQVLEELNIKGFGSDNINKNVDKFLPLNRKIIADGDILDAVKSFSENKFTSFAKQSEITKENTIEFLKLKKADKLKKNAKKYTCQFNGKLYEGDTFEELIDKVHTARLNIEESKNYVQGQTQAIKSALQDAINDPNKPIELKYSPRLETILNRYATPDYRILDCYSEALDSLGIILVQNIFSERIDILVCDTSAHQFRENIKLGGNRQTLTGTFVSDIVAKNKPGELVLASTYGNIKLMETLAALNEMQDVFQNESVIGNIMLFNQATDEGFTASNEELIYNFKELCDLDKKHPMQNNLTKSKFASYLSLVKLRIKEICANPPNHRFKKITSALNDFDQLPTDNIVAIRSGLVKIAQDISDTFNLEHNTKQETLNDQNKSEAYRLLVDIHSAIGALDGVHFRQQLQDHHKYLNQSGLKEAFTKGWSANSLDNPGMLDSDLLNLVGRQLNTGYQNVRDEVQFVTKKLYELGEKLRKEKSFGYLKSKTVGNEASLFENMYDDDYPDDIIFKNPFKDHTMTDTEKEYLKYCLFQINSRRYSNQIHTMQDLESLLNSEDSFKYLRAPLMRGSFSSKVANKGLGYAIKDSFSKLIPNKKNLQEFFRDFLTDEDAVNQTGDQTLKNRMAKAKNKNFELWEMSSNFDAFENEEYRKTVLEPKSESNPNGRGVDFWERNLEVLTTAHCVSYVMKDNINKIFPVLKAVAYQLEYQSFILNDKFAEDVEYLHNFITAKVLNMSIQDPKWNQLSFMAGKLMQGASKLALAFNPRQLYQAIDGLWKDIMLVIKNPDGTEAFSAKNFKDSFFWIYKELGYFSNNKSLARVLNEVYGINDMDMNTYGSKILPNQFGMFNFNNLAFHFSSRPDFYNRMTVFGAHMRADGCFEAHDEYGNYDWTKDKRYEIFAKYAGKENEIPENLKSEFNKQKARYLAVAKQFQNENAKYLNSNGELVDFVVNIEHPLPLPRAYTVLEAESIKSIADMVYGYYSHEKKSLIQSTTAGALFMQMNTFWSSKKNQFMAPGGIRMTGKWVHYSEKDDEGNPIYYYEDDEGNPTTEVTNTPFMVWQGQYQEGIFVTLSNILKTGYENFKDRDDKNILTLFKSFADAHNEFVNNPDENLKTAYRANLSQWWYDLLMMLLLGMLIAPALQTAAKDYTKEVGNENLGDAVINTAMLNTTAMLKTSTEDFFFMHTIFGRGMQWTPFSITTMTNTVKRLSSCISGNTDMYDTLVKLAAVTRTRESVLDCVKINTLGRPIGDNGRKDDN